MNATTALRLLLAAALLLPCAAARAGNQTRNATAANAAGTTAMPGTSAGNANPTTAIGLANDATSADSHVPGTSATPFSHATSSDSPDIDATPSSHATPETTPDGPEASARHFTRELGELSVSAIKQARGQANGGVSSTVITRQQAERGRVTTAKDAIALAPNVTMPDYGSRVTSTIYVRGFGSRIDQSVIGLNVDNVPVMNKSNFDFSMPDIDRVEILRGPQSALFGRNTMGGMINIYTISPLSWQGTRAQAEYGSGNSFTLSAGHYAKLSEGLGLSASVAYGSAGGFFTNEYNHRHCDYERQWSARVKLQWRPGENFRIDNTAAFTHLRQGGYPYQSLATGAISHNDTCYYHRTVFTDGLTMHLRHERFSITSITSAQYSDDNITLDQDFLPQSFFTLTQTNREYSFTEDLIARSTPSAGQGYQWLAGAFGFYRHATMSAPVTLLDDAVRTLIEANMNKAMPQMSVTWNERSIRLGSDFTMPSYGLALYHQSQYTLPHFTFTVSLRGDWEHNALRYHSTCNTGFTLNRQLPNGQLMPLTQQEMAIDDDGKLSKSFFQLLPKVCVQYFPWQARRLSIYASAAKGYKAGGFNTQMFSDILQNRLMQRPGTGTGAAADPASVVSYRPEKAWTYELGASYANAAGTLRMALTAFYIRCTDQQLTVFPDGKTTGRAMANAGRSRSAGLELSLAARPTTALSLALSYGLTSARFTDYADGKADYTHNTVPYAPANTLYAQAAYTISTARHCGDWLQSITLGADLRATGRTWWDEANTVSQPLYALLGAQATLQARHISLQLWARNLTDTRYSTFYFVSMGNAFLQQGRPREIGATLRLQF